MGSTRLPGKVLKPLAEKPLLWHIVHRLRACRTLDEIAIATTTHPRDDTVAAFGAKEGVAVVRGPEDNVLARFALAAETLNADVIVRVSSDAPFIDAGFIDHLVAALIAQGGDYVLMEDGVACAHDGVDPFTRRGLDRLMAEAHHDSAAREHVTGYFKLHPHFAPIARATLYAPLARPSGRLSIDTADDLAFAEAVYARLGAPPGEAALADVLDLLDRATELRVLNAHVRQKPITPAGGLALIRCDGGGSFGYGHVRRMVALARALRDGQGIGVMFALNGSEDALAPVHKAGFAAHLLRASDDLARLTVAEQPDLLILDGRTGPSRAELEHLRAHVPLIAVIDDGAERRLAADLAYYPPVPQAHALDWAGAHAAVRIGWQWALLGIDPHRMPVRTAAHGLLVAMGGSDPFGLTLRAAKALMPLDAPVRFVIGAGMKDAAGIVAAIHAMRPGYETVEGADDLSADYARAGLALCAFGVTAYELAAFGVPAIYLGISEDHARSASAFEGAGMGVSLGPIDRVSDVAMLSAVRDLMNDLTRLSRMRTAGPTLLDSKGAARIAADLAATMEKIKEQPRLRASA